MTSNRSRVNSWRAPYKTHVKSIQSSPVLTLPVEPMREGQYGPGVGWLLLQRGEDGELR